MKITLLSSIGRLLPRLLVVVSLVAIAQPAQAQRGPGGFGGPGGFSRGGFDRGSMLGMVQRESVQSELGITDEQKAKLPEIQTKVGEAMREAFSGGFDPSLSDEERRARFEQVRENSRKLAEGELQKLLTQPQFQRLKQMALQEAGLRGMLQPDVASDLKLTDQQKEDLQQLREDRDRAMREQNIFRASDEDRQKFNDEWDAKARTLLTPTQAKSWQEKLGPPAAGQSATSTSDTNAAKTTTSATTSPAPTPHRATVENPTGEAPDGQVVMSFGTAAEAGAKPANGGARTLTFNFRFAPWVDVLKRFADAADLTLDLNDIPPGTFSYYDSGEYTPTEALDILNGYLLQKGYLLVRRDKFLVVVNIDEGVPPNLIPSVPLEELPNRGKNELVSIILPLEGVNAEDAAREVEALVGPQGKVVPLKNSNALYISDIGSNLRQIQRLMASVTAKANPDEVQFRSFSLKHVPAVEAEKTLRSLFGLSQAVPNVSSSRSSSSRYGYGGPPFGFDSRRDDNRSPSPPPMSLSAANKIQVASDPRTNTVMVTAPAAQMAIAEQAIKTIDVAEDANGQKIEFDDGSPHLKVYQIHSADAQEVTKTLDAIMPGVVVNEDGRARRIHVVATTAQHREIERLISQLDGSGGGSQSLTVIPLMKHDPLAVSGTLRSLFAADGNAAPTIEADSMGRRLMIRGSADQVTSIRAFLAQIGENGQGFADDSRPRGPVRVVPLQGRDPDEFLRMLEAIWSSTDSNPIRVVVPPAANPVRERRTPTSEQRPLLEQPRQTRGSVSGPDTTQSIQPRSTPVAVRSASQTKVLEEEGTSAAASRNAPEGESEVPTAVPVPEENDAATAKQKPRSPAPRSDDAPVAVSATGGNLILSSEDEAALDRLEQLIDRLGQTVPPRTRWTVFYLRSAEATEVALMLEQLLPSSSVSMSADSGSSGFLGGLSSMGSSLMQAAGVGTLGGSPQALRIIPDTRSNSLFVSGPADKVRDVEEMLKVLDASELPESLRDRLPRMIPVEYTDAEEVAAIVKEVYKDYMEDKNSQQSRGNNPLAMFMGGGNSNDQRNRRRPAIELTIGVDTRTNQLIVSANDTLFRQIENLVATLDQSAYEAKRTVRVVRLDHADSAVVQQAVTSLLPKVHVSSGGGGKKTSSGSDSKGGSSGQSSQSSQSSDRGGSDADAVRRYFEQRMRERMQGGGDSGRGSSGFGFPGRSSSDGRPSWGGFGSGRSSSSSSRGSGR